MKLINYPKERLEWVILDSWGRNGTIAKPLFENNDIINKVSKEIGIKIKYEYRKEAMEIGKKRNQLVKMSSNNIVINYDSDDIYLPNYIQYSVGTLLKNKRQCVGSPQMLFIYPNDNYKITYIQCKPLRLIHEATMCHTKKHWKRMGGYGNSSQGEGSKMIDGCKEALFEKTDIRQIMVCVCGDHNTINKEQFNTNENEMKDCDLSFLPQIDILKTIFT